MAPTLEKRLRALEAAWNSVGDGGGCDRCRGPVVTIRSATTGEFHKAILGGKPLTEEEARANKCPNCGRTLDTGQGPSITIGGGRS